MGITIITTTVIGGISVGGCGMIVIVVVVVVVTVVIATSIGMDASMSMQSGLG